MVEEVSEYRSLEYRGRAGSAGAEEHDQKIHSGGEAKGVGPAQCGPSIDDLFSHSYSPLVKIPKPGCSHKWFWVVATRVWDSGAERFLASASDIR